MQAKADYEAALVMELQNPNSPLALQLAGDGRLTADQVSMIEAAQTSFLGNTAAGVPNDQNVAAYNAAISGIPLIKDISSSVQFALDAVEYQPSLLAEVVPTILYCGLLLTGGAIGGLLQEAVGGLSSALISLAGGIGTLVKDVEGLFDSPTIQSDYPGSPTISMVTTSGPTGGTTVSLNDSSDTQQVAFNAADQPSAYNVTAASGGSVSIANSYVGATVTTTIASVAAAGHATSMTMSGTVAPDVEVAEAGQSVAPIDQDDADANAILVGMNNATLNGGAGKSFQVALGNDVNVVDDTGANQVLLDGTGETADVSGASVTLGAGSSADVTGNFNAVSDNTMGYVAFVGNQNSITAGTSADINLIGINVTSTAGNGSYVGVVAGSNITLNESDSTTHTGNNVGLVLDGSGDMLAVGTNSVASVVGSNDTSSIGMGGTLNVIGSSDADTGGAATSINLNGSNDSATVGAGSYVGIVSGTGDTANISSGTFDSLNNLSFNLVGSNDQGELGAGSTVGVFGVGDTIQVDSGATATVLGAGSGNTTGTDLLNFAGAGSEQVLLDPSSSVLMQDVFWSQNGAAGTNTQDVLDFSASGAGSEQELFNPGTGIAQTDNFFAGSNDTGATNATFNLNASGQDISGKIFENSASFVVSGGTITDSGSGDTITGSASAVSDGGAGNAIDVSNATITLSAGEHVTIVGSGDTVMGASGDVVSLSGTSDTVMMNSGTVDLAGSSADGLVLSGGGDTLNGGVSNDSITVENTGTVSDAINAAGDQSIFVSSASVNVYGSGNTVADQGASDSTGIYGASNTLKGATGSDYVMVGGDSSSNISVVDASSDTNINVASGSAANISGGNDTIYSSTGGYVGLLGSSGYAVNGSDLQVDTAASTSFNISGSNDLAVLGSSSYLGVLSGTGNTVDASNDTINTLSSTSVNLDGSGDSVGIGLNGAAYFGLIGGSGNSLTGSNDAVGLVSGVSGSLSGGTDTVTLSASDTFAVSGGSADVINCATAGNTISLSGTSGGLDTVDGANQTITLGENTDVNANGSGSTITLNSGGGDTIGLNDGGGDVVSGSETGDTVGFYGTGSNADVVSGSGGAVNVGTGAYGDANGGHYDVTLSSGGEATIGLNAGGYNVVSGALSGDTVGFYGSGGDVDTLYGSGAAVNVGASSVVNTSGANFEVTLSSGGADTLGLFGGGNDVIGGAQAGDVISANQTAGAFDAVYGNSADLYVAADAQLSASGDDDQISASAGASVDAYGGANVIDDSGTGQHIYVADTAGSFDTVNGSGTSTISLAVNSQANVNGGSDPIFVSSGDSLGAYGGGNTISGITKGDAIVVGSTGGSYDNLSGSGDDGGTSANGQSGSISLNSASQANITGQDDRINSTSADTEHVSGANDTINASGSTVDLSSNDSKDAVAGNSDALNLGTNVSLGLAGTGDTTTGAGDDTLYARGTYDVVNATNSDIVFSGADTGDLVGGSGDIGYDWADPGDGQGYAGGPPGTGYGDPYGGPYGFVSTPGDKALTGIDVIAQFDRAHGLAAAAGLIDDARSAAVASDSGLIPASPFEGGRWASNSITYSFTDSSASPQIDGTLPLADQAVVEQAMDAWAAAAGFTPRLVADSSSTDIRIGWSDLDTVDSGVIGFTSTPNSDGILEPGAVVRLANPEQDPLQDSSADGKATYSIGDVSLYQVALHEIGHALGLAESSDPRSVMYFLLSSANASLSAGDVANIRTVFSADQSPLSSSASQLFSSSSSSPDLLPRLSSIAAPVVLSGSGLQVGDQSASDVASRPGLSFAGLKHDDTTLSVPFHSGAS
jgi:hypothetical protein